MRLRLSHPLELPYLYSMLFNSIEYLIFLPTVFILYWLIQDKIWWRNLLIVAVSYLFYGWWDWRFLGLIIFSSVVDYSIGRAMGRASDARVRKRLLYMSLATNLGILGFFKYFNFFTESFADAMQGVGVAIDPFTLSIVLPVGISFYTFQTLSYTIDVYRKKIEPTEDVVAFFAFVSFFPQLVAGPIERASRLLPQFSQSHTFDLNNAKNGLRQILWGLFKKVVIADNCAPMVNQIFDNYETQPAPVLLLGAVYFAFQIYGDFSGYSDIAIGTARLFGFKLMQNFAYPYFARDMAEFWRRWHISLSTWFRDYLYIPLGGSRVSSQWLVVRNVAAIFIVSGFWHGANWTFIFWGALNALYFLPLILRKKNRSNLEIVAADKMLPSLREFSGILLTFALTCLAWIFFRAENIAQAFDYILHITHLSMDFSRFNVINHGSVIALIVILVLVEWVNRRKEFPMQNSTLPVVIRWAIYLILCILILANGDNNDSFIYFQF